MTPRASMRAALWANLLSLTFATPTLCQMSVDQLRGDGSFEIVKIAGFLIPIDDIQTLQTADVFGINPNTNRFAFSRQITSERLLSHSLKDLTLQNERAVRDLYRSAKIALPNGVAHTLTVPSGFGPASFSNQSGGTALGISTGGVSRVPYTNKADGGLAFRLSFGNSFETLGGNISVSLNDLSDLSNKDRISVGFEISRYITDGVSVALGGENLLVNYTDGEDSYYVAGSWAFDADDSVMPFQGVATFGLGSGRFANKTPRDTFEGKGTDGTVAFAAIAWEINEHVNLIADWNGRNLTIGGAFRVPNSNLSVKLGVRDLTDNTGDGARLTGSIGYTIARF